jgi:hypothetical protein
VDLSRALALGQATAAGAAGHLAYLVAGGAAGVLAARVTYRRRLLV